MPAAAPTPDAAAAPIDAADADVRGRVEAVLEQLRPAVRADGGDVELIDVAGGVARVRFHGACVGCPSSHLTLHHGIERWVRHAVPEITGVVAVG